MKLAVDVSVELKDRRAVIRRGVLAAIAVSLLFLLLHDLGCFEPLRRYFHSGDELFVTVVLVATVIVFTILYRTPFLQSKTAENGVARVMQLVLIAHGFVFGTMLGAVIVWFLMCALLGIPPRDI